MKEEDKRAYIERYETRFQQYGCDPRTLGWFKGRQKLRFYILTSIGNLDNRSILDLGCGFADLYDYLIERGWRGKYTGYDIVPKLIEVAKQRHPKLDLQVKDILTDPVTENFDYVFASGVFNAKLSGDNESYIRDMLARMFEIADVGVAVDFLSTYVDFQQEIAYHADPTVIFKMCKNLSKRVTLHHDYMPYEFTVYIYKNDSINKEKSVFTDFLSIL